MSECVKTCPCCKRVYTAEQWRDLPLLGVMRFPGEPTLELRNCDCYSTMAIEVQPEAAE